MEKSKLLEIIKKISKEHTDSRNAYKTAIEQYSVTGESIDKMEYCRGRINGLEMAAFFVRVELENEKRPIDSDAYNFGKGVLNGVWMSVLLWLLIIGAVLISGCAETPKEKCFWDCRKFRTVPDCNYICEGADNEIKSEVKELEEKNGKNTTL